MSVCVVNANIRLTLDVNVDEMFDSLDFYFRNGIDRQFRVNIIPCFFRSLLLMKIPAVF